MRNRIILPTAATLLWLSLSLMHAQPVTISVDAENPGKAISPELFGIFFEDLNYAADGGLYAELIQNRSFEYQAAEQRTWNPLSFWEVTTLGGGKGSVAIEMAEPLHPNNPHYAVLEVAQSGEGVGLVNSGFDGIPVKAGESYDVSVFARQLYVGARWGGTYQGKTAPLIARLESANGQKLGEVSLNSPGWDWTHLTGTITATQTDNTARFVLMTTGRGGVALDVISLFPKKTFRNRPNGLRADLAQVISDLKPKFVRFPGGCLAHGNGLNNMYRWEDTIGPIEQRKEQPNLWGYHQSVGLGYFEYFQFCEDIGAEPLPVVPAGVCCQNSNHTGEHGQKGLPLELMPAYIQEVLDLIEWANGPTNTVWGAKRAAAGHPEPFHLKHIGVGNEDTITPVFKERFQMIYDAMKKVHPEIVVIGTVGPRPDGEDFEKGWKFATELQVPMVDEHYYEPPQWFWDNLKRYDTYDRNKTKVYLGEYAAHDNGRVNTLRSALAEAACMTSLERNGDIVRMSSYAPLLAREGHTQWRPDMIYFTGTNVLLSVNYYAQQMFSVNYGDTFLPTSVSAGASPSAKLLSMSCVKESQSGDVILKIVNGSDTPLQTEVRFSPVASIQPRAVRTVLAGDLQSSNSFQNPGSAHPVASDITVGSSFPCEVPAYSLTVIRMKTR